MIVIERTLSGGACWNDVSIQTVQRGLPFGGVGESGCECSGLSGSRAGLTVVVIGGSGLPGEIDAIIKIEAAQRTPEQTAKLRDYHRSIDTSWREAKADVRRAAALLVRARTMTPLAGRSKR